MRAIFLIIYWIFVSLVASSSDLIKFSNWLLRQADPKLVVLNPTHLWCCRQPNPEQAGLTITKLRYWSESEAVIVFVRSRRKYDLSFDIIFYFANTYFLCSIRLFFFDNFTKQKIGLLCICLILLFYIKNTLKTIKWAGVWAYNS